MQAAHTGRFFHAHQEADISNPREALLQRQAQAEANGLRWCSGCKNELDPGLFHQSALGGAFRIPSHQCAYCNSDTTSKPLTRQRVVAGKTITFSSGLLPRPEPWRDPRTDQSAPTKGTDSTIPSYSYGVPTK